jgi:transcriptional regulator with XRE-family HTH domain
VGWRERLTEAVRQSGRKRNAIARDAGIDPTTLSRILHGGLPHISFQIVARIAYATGVSLGWLLEEQGFELSPLQIEEVEQVIGFLRDAVDRSDTSELLRLRTIIGHSTVVVPNSIKRKEAGEYTWRSLIRRVRREEYRERIAKLRPMLSVFRNGRLEVAASAGGSGMLYVRTADGKPFYVGGAHTEAAYAITEAVNLVLDLCAPELPDDRSASEGGSRQAARR